MKKTKTEKGITLVALIITIIVLLILAVVAIGVVTGEGILFHAKDASTKYAEKAEEENSTIQSYTDMIAEQLGEENLGPWVQEGTNITNSEGQKLQIGDTIVNYNPSVNGYSGKWKILGVEKGKILLMSSSDVENLTLTGKEGYNTGINQLDDMCKKFADGIKGESARSIRVEDINRIIGYDPKVAEDGKKYGNGTGTEFENKITYTVENGISSYQESRIGGSSGNVGLRLEFPDGRILRRRWSKLH